MKKIFLSFSFFLFLFCNTANADTRIFYPTKDTYVDSDLSTYFYGQANSLQLGRKTLPPIRYFNGTNYVIQLRSSYKRALIQFSFLGLPTGAIINSAKLRFFQTSMGGYNNINLRFSSNSASWAETGTNDDNCPNPVSPTYNSATSAGVIGVYSEWDITNIARGWFNGTYANNGLQIEGTPPNEDNDWWIMFAAREDSSHKPSLIIDYTIPSPTNTPTPTRSPTLAIRFRMPPIVTNTPSPTLQPGAPTNTLTPTPTISNNPDSITPFDQVTIYPTPEEGSSDNVVGTIFDNNNQEITPSITGNNSPKIQNKSIFEKITLPKWAIALSMVLIIIIILVLGLYFLNKENKKQPENKEITIKNKTNIN